MRRRATELLDVLLFEPDGFGHENIFEAFRQRDFDAATGMRYRFVQENQSTSAANVIRGLHYQVRKPQGKLARVIEGEVFNVCVDLRRGSSTFGRWLGTRLSASNRNQIWIPPGFAHGFAVTDAPASLLYKTTDFRSPQDERCLLWNDPTLGIAWPLTSDPILSARDLNGIALGKAEVFF